MKNIKKYTNGTHRACSPEKTLKRITPMMPKMGITRVANLTGLDNIGIPVIGVYRPNSKSLATSQGKGHSINAAKVSGIMESIENYHAENIEINTKFACQKNVKNSIPAHLLSQSCEKDFDKNTCIKWAECKYVYDNSHVWLPYELINTDFSLSNEHNTGHFIADSNGLASGNTLIEAINHGLFEVIERDCLATWQLTPENIQSQHRINIDTIQDEYLRLIINTIIKKDILIGIWDITNDIKIPTFLCKIISKENNGTRPAYGSGTHIDKNIALSRAITEAAQSRLTFIAGARDDQYHEIYENETSQETYNTWINEIKDGHSIISYSDIPLINFGTFEEDQNHIIKRLKDVNLSDACYADLTKAEFNIPVVKVIIPGTEGITSPEKRLLGKRGIKLYDQYGVGACEVI